MRRLMLLPIAVLIAVLAVPFVFGDHPVRWAALEHASLTQADRLPPDVRRLIEPAIGKIPEQYADPPASSAGNATARPAPQLRPVRNPYPVRIVQTIWSPGTPEFGIQVYWVSNPADSEHDVWGKAQRIVNYVVGLKANSIAISFPMYMRGINGSEVFARAGTPSPQRLEILVRQAHAAGLRVTLRPLLDEAALDPPKGWRGNIAPGSLPDWFASYQTFLGPYVELARRRNVATFVVGTEMNSLEPEGKRWRALIAWAKTRYSGDLDYNLNWDNYLLGTYPAGAHRYGVDAYFPVVAEDSAGPSVIARSWLRTLRTAKGELPQPVMLSEVGISAKRGAFHFPGGYSGIGQYDARIQPAWYRGVCSVARTEQFAGIYFWKLDFDADPAGPADYSRPNLDFIGYPEAEQAIRECLSQPWKVASPSN